MEDFFQPILNLLKAEYVAAAGYVLMTTIIFVETGLLVGFCLPGDSLLVTAGMFAAGNQFGLDVKYIIACLIPAAICGDTLGYWIGRKTGPMLFRREKSLFFNPKHLVEAGEFYKRHGGKAVVLARFVPIVRTFTPVVSGMAKMEYPRFLGYSIFGSIFWITSMTLLGYGLANVFPNLNKRIDLVILVVVFVSVLPMVVTILRNRYIAKKAASEAIAELEARRAGEPFPKPGLE